MARQFDMSLALAKVGSNKTLRVTIDGVNTVLPGRVKQYTDDGLVAFLEGMPRDSKLTVSEPAQVTETGIALRPRSVQDPRDLANIVRERHAYLTTQDDAGKPSKAKNRGGVDSAVNGEPAANGAASK